MPSIHLDSAYNCRSLVITPTDWSLETGNEIIVAAGGWKMWSRDCGETWLVPPEILCRARNAKGTDFLSKSGMEFGGVRQVLDATAYLGHKCNLKAIAAPAGSWRICALGSRIAFPASTARGRLASSHCSPRQEYHDTCCQAGR
jgi:hypothetical protein